MGDVEPCDTQSDSDRPRDMDDVPCDSQSDSDHSVASSAESSALSSRVACARDEVVAPVVSDTSGSKRKRSIEGHVLEPPCAVFGAGPAVETSSAGCELPVGVAEADARMARQRRPPVVAVHSGQPPLREATAQCVATPRHLLSGVERSELSEGYGEDQNASDLLFKLHSLCTREALNTETLACLVKQTERRSVIMEELEVVPKSHDDLFLRPARVDVGERECVCGERCVARVIAGVRYGRRAAEKFAFTCVEFLRPSELTTFIEGGGLPSRRGKCLLCVRYFTSYQYELARQDPRFLDIVRSGNLRLQLFQNRIGMGSAGGQSDDETRADVLAPPVVQSSVRTADGYPPGMCLFVDETFSDSACGRGPLAALAWKPVVRFRSTDYRYIVDEGGARLVQVLPAEGSHELTRGRSDFRQPPAATGSATGGNAMKQAVVRGLSSY